MDDYDPDETYYRLLPEGMFEDYDGETQDGRPNNFDLNRQFPSNFSPGGLMDFSGDGDGGPPGAGPCNYASNLHGACSPIGVGIVLTDRVWVWLQTRCTCRRVNTW